MSATKKEFFVQNFLVAVAFRWGRKSQRTFLQKKKNTLAREKRRRGSQLIELRLPELWLPNISWIIFCDSMNLFLAKSVFVAVIHFWPRSSICQIAIAKKYTAVS